ncbi:MAG: MerR family transcriptional regulator [Pseudomonadota bacterium]
MLPSLKQDFGSIENPNNATQAPDGNTATARSEKSDRAFRTIGEAAAELSLKPHVLRFWETKFPQISPMKRKDGRRFYRPEDMEALRAIQTLLHDRGMTIRGAQKLLNGQASTHVEPNVAPLPADEVASGRSQRGLSESAAGKSVRDLQSTVRQAVEGGAFDSADDDASKARLGRLLTDLTDLKARLDQVRTIS